MASFDQVQLPDGRRMDIRASGPETGTPVVFHHGTPGARSPIRALERAAHERNLRVIFTSRPGYGDSTRNFSRRVVDVVPDIAAVLDALGYERCLVAGWSGGGPHALACAARLPSTAAVLVIAGVAPYGDENLDWMNGMGEENLTEFHAATQGPAALSEYLQVQREQLVAIAPEDIVASLASLLPEVDRKVLTDEFGEDMASSFHEALSNGVDGWLDDDLAFVNPWGFEMEEIAVPAMIWQGSADLMVPFPHGKWLSSHIPTARPHLLEGEGHLSLALGALEEMLDELVEAGAR